MEQEHLRELDVNIWACRVHAKRCHAQLRHLLSPGAVLLWDFVQDFNVPHLQAEELGQQLPNPGCHPCAALFELPRLHIGDGHPYLKAFAGLAYLMAVAAL